MIFPQNEGGNTFHINPQLLPPHSAPPHSRGGVKVGGSSICVLECVSYSGIRSRDETGEERNVVRLFRDPDS